MAILYQNISCEFYSPFRKKVGIINRKLAERYKDHPALVAWHISNEYGGECHCDLCQEAFRNWLKKRYSSLDNLNQTWWTYFWNHTYTDWSQVESPSPRGETSVNGQTLDWKRFVTDQTVDFMKNEMVPLRELTPYVPITTNFMGTYTGLNYWKFAKELDVISWDSYPQWKGDEEDWKLACNVSFIHDINRSLKGGKPFMLMESTPSITNWMSVGKLKRPGVHILSSLQAVAHGSDTVQYFQFRKGRGGAEKFHGAVVDHFGHENNRVFRDVTDVGEALSKLDPIIGTSVKPQVAVIYDWENRWAIDEASGPRIEHKDYEETCKRHYRECWKRGIPADIIDMDCDFSSYKLLIAPILYMIRPGVGERIEKFVKDGGTFISSYWSGIVDEHDLCNLGGFPGPLRKVLGIWSEEIDALFDDDKNYVVPVADNSLGLNKEYQAGVLCDIIHAETAKVLATYREDFYAGYPALTVNEFGKGKAYYIASRNEDIFLNDFYNKIVADESIKQVMDTELPEGVTAQMRTDGETDYVFIMNFKPEEKEVSLNATKYTNLLTGEIVLNKVVLKGFGISVLSRKTV